MTHSILILGAGIIGSALAYRLSESGADVTLLDPSRDGGTASAASFGWINASYENPRPYYTLRRHAMEAWTRLAPGLPGLSYTANGTIYADFYGVPLERLYDEDRHWGYPFEWMDAGEVARREPHLALTPERALFCGIEAQVLPHVAARTLAKASGARRITAAADGLITCNGRITGVETAAGPLFADLVILAAGSQSDTLAQTAGISLPLHAPPGLLIHSKPAPPLIQHTILTDGLHMQQRPDGTLTAGGDFGGGAINDDPETGSHLLFARLQQALNTPEPLAFSHHTLGLRPTPRDGLPIVGSPAPGLYVTVMHSGATLAPGIAELASAEILTGHRDPLLEPFHPARFDAA